MCVYHVATCMHSNIVSVLPCVVYVHITYHNMYCPVPYPDMTMYKFTYYNCIVMI